MTKIKRPKGLIKFASYNAIKSGNHRVFTPRLVGYTGVLIILLAIFTTVLLSRKDIETTILRSPGTLYQELGNGDYSNVYQFKIVNKTYNDIPVTFKLRDKDAIIKFNQQRIVVPQNNLYASMMVVELSRNQLNPGRNKIVFQVMHDEELIEEVSTAFQAPIDLK